MANAPKTPDEVSLNQNDRGDYYKVIGKSDNGKSLMPKKWYFGRVESAAKVAAHNKMEEWDAAKNAKAESWEKWEQLKIINQAFKQTAERIAEKGKLVHADIVKAEPHTAARTYPHLPGTEINDIAIADASTQYLTAQKARIGLMGSRGIAAYTYDINAYRLQRAMEFLPPECTHLSHLHQTTLQTWIDTIAARPEVKPNEHHKTKREGQMSQSTALALINAVRQFLTWAESQESISWRTPKAFNTIFAVRPEPEKQSIRTIDAKTFKRLWDGCINEAAHTKDKGERRRLYLLLGLNCGFYQDDIASLLHSHIKLSADGKSVITRVRKKTRKSNRKLVEASWELWPETVDLIKKYLADENKLGAEGVKSGLRAAFLSDDGKALSANNVKMAWNRLLESTGIAGYSFSNLRDTGAQFCEGKGGQSLADMYLAHSRRGVTDSYAAPAWEALPQALRELRQMYIVDQGLKITDGRGVKAKAAKPREAKVERIG